MKTHEEMEVQIQKLEMKIKHLEDTCIFWCKSHECLKNQLEDSKYEVEQFVLASKLDRACIYNMSDENKKYRQKLESLKAIINQ